MSSAGTVEERDILDRRYCAARLVKNNDAKLLSFGVKGVSTGEWPWVGSGNRFEDVLPDRLVTRLKNNVD
jgi:anti-sigma factor ChrR (cupin superfamily)